MSLSISIVTCSYQQGKYLDATIRSVLDQRYEPLEYIIIDGGSTDQSVEIIKRHEPHLAYWVSEKDKGQTHALSKGFARSHGEIMGWLCSDDLLLPDALHRVSAYFEAHPEADFVFGDALWIDAEGRYIRPKKEMPWHKFITLYAHNYLAQPSCFWRRSLFDKVNGLDDAWHLCMDFDLWLRFSHHTRPHHLNAYLGCMRDYPEQKTRSLRARGWEEIDMLRRREMPVLSRCPAGPLKLAGQAGRVGIKALLGGYWARPPERVLSALDQYRIT